MTWRQPGQRPDDGREPPDSYVHPGDVLSHGEIKRRNGIAADALTGSRMTQEPWWFVMPMESGHTATFQLSGQTGRYSMLVHHPGDPSGTHVESDLGEDPAAVPERAASELRHRDVTRALVDQYRRADANGDPTGSDEARRHQQRQEHYTVQVSHLFRHYE